MNSFYGRRSLMPARFAVALTLCGLAAIAATAAQERGGRSNARNNPDEKEWIQLFNGRDLNDWSPKFAHHDLGENFNDTFRVEDGLLKVRYDKWQNFTDEFGHLFYKEPFSYYLLAAEYRFVGEQVAGGPGWAVRNNGLMLHSPHPKTMLKDQDFPISIAVQLLGDCTIQRHEAISVARPAGGRAVLVDGAHIGRENGGLRHPHDRRHQPRVRRRRADVGETRAAVPRED